MWRHGMHYSHRRHIRKLIVREVPRDSSHMECIAICFFTCVVILSLLHNGGLEEKKLSVVWTHQARRWQTKSRGAQGIVEVLHLDPMLSTDR